MVCRNTFIYPIHTVLVGDAPMIKGNDQRPVKLVVALVTWIPVSSHTYYRAGVFDTESLYD